MPEAASSVSHHGSGYQITVVVDMEILVIFIAVAHYLCPSTMIEDLQEKTFFFTKQVDSHARSVYKQLRALWGTITILRLPQCTIAMQQSGKKFDGKC